MKKVRKSVLFWIGFIPIGIMILSAIIVALLHRDTGFHLFNIPSEVISWALVFLVDLVLVLLFRYCFKRKKLELIFDDCCNFWLDSLRNIIFPLVLVWLGISLFGEGKLDWVTGCAKFIYLLIMAQKIVFLFVEYSHMVEKDMEKLNIKK